MRPSQPARRSRDYTRHGTTSLFTALDIASGRIIGKCYERHRAAEFRKFLDEVEAAVLRELDIHLVMDNYATRKTPLIRKGWLNDRVGYAETVNIQGELGCLEGYANVSERPRNVKWLPGGFETATIR